MRMVVQSSCQLDYELLDFYGLDIVHFPFSVNGERFDSAESDEPGMRDQMRDILLKKENRVVTHAFSEVELKSIIDKGLKKSEKVLLIFQSLKTTPHVEKIWEKLKSENPVYEESVVLFNSKALSTVYSIQVLQAAKMRKEGKGMDEVLSALENFRKNSYSLGILFDLFYMSRMGRISYAKSLLATAVGAYPLLSYGEEEGSLKSVGVARDYKSANKKFIKILKRQMKGKKASRISLIMTYFGPHEAEIGHMGRLLKETAERSFWNLELEVTYSRFVNAVHEGPDFYELGYIIHS